MKPLADGRASLLLPAAIAGPAVQPCPVDFGGTTEILQEMTTFYEPAHDSGHHPSYWLGDRTGFPPLSASATTAMATATASGPAVASTLTTQIISSAV
jgi:hypothetical protein